MANIIKLPINNPVLATYSQLSLEGNLYKRTPMVPAFLYIFELTFYIKMDTSLRGTHSANPKGDCLRESQLYHMNLVWWLKLPLVLCSSAAKHLDKYRAWKITWIPARPLGKKLSHLACARLLLAYMLMILLESWTWPLFIRQVNFKS